MTMETSDHASLMNATYRYQRLFYDTTRRFFLFGRDRLIAGLDAPRGSHVLEIACGTGRNLAKIRRRYPGVSTYGLDISTEMLRSARAKLGPTVPLAQADACSFEAAPLLGQADFDRVIMSYCVSMIPDWARAADTALSHVAPGGSLHIVDFGDLSAYPEAFRAIQSGWIAKFHVTRRTEFREVLEGTAIAQGCSADFESWFGGYAWAAVLRRPDGGAS